MCAKLWVQIQHLIKKIHVVVVVEAVIPALGRVEAEVILGYRWGSAWDIRYNFKKKIKKVAKQVLGG